MKRWDKSSVPYGVLIEVTTASRSVLSLAVCALWLSPGESDEATEALLEIILTEGQPGWKNRVEKVQWAICLFGLYISSRVPSTNTQADAQFDRGHEIAGQLSQI